MSVLPIELKPHIEMERLDLSSGWRVLDGFPPGVEVKRLADDLDEALCTGARSRLVRFGPGTITHGTLSHSYWEEVYLLQGDMYAIDPSSTEIVEAPCYSCRPPGARHGPFGSRGGCLLFEVHYYPR